MAAPTAPRPGRYARAAHDTGFLLAQLPLAIAGFVLMVLVPSLGVPLLVLGIGVVVLGGLLTAVNGIGELTRDRLRAHGHRLEQGTRPPRPERHRVAPIARADAARAELDGRLPRAARLPALDHHLRGHGHVVGRGRGRSALLVLGPVPPRRRGLPRARLA